MAGDFHTYPQIAGAHGYFSQDFTKISSKLNFTPKSAYTMGLPGLYPPQEHFQWQNILRSLT
jgi:hypothetical protein